MQLSLVTESLPTAINRAELRAALAAAAAAWSYPTIACTNLVVTMGPDATGRLVEPDGLSKIFFRTKAWCHNERCGGVRTFSLAAAAMTTRHHRPTLEADIEINAVSYAWDRGAGVPSKRRASLRTVLAHEIGHALGLDDACASSHGQPLKTGCAETMTIMYAPGLFDAPQEADVSRVCSLYPRALGRTTGTYVQPLVCRGLLLWVVAGALLLAIHLKHLARGI